MYKAFAAALLLTLSMVGATLAVPTPALAYPSSSSYTPTHGEVIADVHGDFFELTISFTMTPYQRDRLEATAEFLELDFVVYGVTIAGDSQDYDVYGNLPGAQEDVNFEDSIFTPAVTMIQTKKIEANKHYWATVKFHSGTTGTPKLSAQFVPSRWHDQSLTEWGACKVGQVKWDGAWCVFPVEDARSTLTRGLVPIDGSHYTLDPGRLDLRQPGNIG